MRLGHGGHVAADADAVAAHDRGLLDPVLVEYPQSQRFGVIKGVEDSIGLLAEHVSDACIVERRQQQREPRDQLSVELVEAVDPPPHGLDDLGRNRLVCVEPEPTRSAQRRHEQGMTVGGLHDLVDLLHRRRVRNR